MSSSAPSNAISVLTASVFTPLTTFEVIYEPITPKPPQTTSASSLPTLPRAFAIPQQNVSAPPSFTVPLAIQGYFLTIASINIPVTVGLYFYSDPGGLKQLFTNIFAITTTGSGTTQSFGQVVPIGSQTAGFYALPQQIDPGEAALFALVPNYLALDPSVTTVESRGYIRLQATSSSAGQLLVSVQTRTILVTPGNPVVNEVIYDLPTANGTALINVS